MWGAVIFWLISAQYFSGTPAALNSASLHCLISSNTRRLKKRTSYMYYTTLHTHMHTRTHARTHAHTHTCVRTHTHAHTHTPFSSLLIKFDTFFKVRLALLFEHHFSLIYLLHAVFSNLQQSGAFAPPPLFVHIVHCM